MSTDSQQARVSKDIDVESRNLIGGDKNATQESSNDDTNLPKQPQPPSKITAIQTPEEQRNISIVQQYMTLAYSPTLNTGSHSVSHLCTLDSWFSAPTTFPSCHTPMDYAESHSHVMSSISDLHIVSYDQIFAKDGHVLLRYTAEGSHVGEPHNGIEATGKKARWTAAAIFEVKDGKVHSFVKDWDKLNMWKQLGWMRGEEYA